MLQHKNIEDIRYVSKISIISDIFDIFAIPGCLSRLQSLVDTFFRVLHPNVMRCYHSLTGSRLSHLFLLSITVLKMKTWFAALFIIFLGLFVDKFVHARCFQACPVSCRQLVGIFHGGTYLSGLRCKRTEERCRLYSHSNKSLRARCSANCSLIDWWWRCPQHLANRRNQTTLHSARADISSRCWCWTVA